MASTKCNYDFCDRDSRTRGWCDTHYRQIYEQKREPRPICQADISGPDGEKLTPWRRDGKGSGRCKTYLNESGVMFRRCSHCDSVKTMDNFSPDKHDALAQRAHLCKECKRINVYQRSHYLKKFGLDEFVYNVILRRQNGLCAICKKPSKKRLAVDHCHDTGKVRGLLCFNCNSMLGQAKDSEGNLWEGIEYLRRSRAPVA